MLIPFFCLCIVFNIVNQETAQMPYPDLFLNTLQQHQGWGNRDNRVIILRPILSGSDKPPSLCFWGQSYSEPWNKANDSFFPRLIFSWWLQIPALMPQLSIKAGCSSTLVGGSYCCQCFSFSNCPNSDVVAPGSSCSSIFNSCSKWCSACDTKIKMSFNGHKKKNTYSNYPGWNRWTKCFSDFA